MALLELGRLVAGLGLALTAVAAIGASSTAKRLAVAYIAFKLIAALIALILFPFVTPLIVRVSQSVDSVTLLAAYHTAYNVVGVAILSR